MKGRRACSAFLVLIFVVSLAAPAALANPFTPGPLQATTSSSTSAGACFGLNGVNDSFIPRTISTLRIALIKPILTATPYSQYDTGSFYAFYAKEIGVTTNVTTNLDLLSTNVSSGAGFSDGWGLSYNEYLFFTSQAAVNCGLVMGKNVQVLTDMDVANGGLFSQNGSARFDVVVLPFSEYVEAQEYLAYEDFVAGGGTLVIMGHSLEYPVTYNATTNIETLVYGHNWAYNGEYAYPIPCGSNTYLASCPWAKNNTDWLGSNTCEASCFHTYVYNGSVVNTGSVIGRDLYNEFGGTVFKSYVAHEEDTVTNMTDTKIVAVFVNDTRNLVASYGQNGSGNLIASYTHQYKKGMVVGFGFFGDDIIATDQSAQYFMLLGIVSSRLQPNSIFLAASTTSSTTVSTTPTTTSSTLGNSTTYRGPHRLPPPQTLAAVTVAVGGLTAVAIVLILRRRDARKRAPELG